MSLSMILKLSTFFFRCHLFCVCLQVTIVEDLEGREVGETERNAPGTPRERVREARGREEEVLAMPGPRASLTL